MRVTTFVRAERAVYVLVDRKPVSEHSSREEAKREAARLAAWVDGPDSEAARAGRGESESNRQWLRGLAAGFEAGSSESDDAWLHAPLTTSEQRMVDRVKPGEGLPMPDPDHVPAVRRVVAWTDEPGWPAEGCLAWSSADDAYDSAVSTPLQKCLEARGENYGSWVRLCGQGHADKVVKRWARLLRHRDEKAGHR